MCARYCLREQNALIADLFELSEVPDLEPRYNIPPTTPVPVVLDEGGGRVLRMMRWGLIPSWSREPFDGAPLINARIETVAEKPAYRAPVRRRRCLMPASGYYEWRAETGGKQPYLFQMADGAPFAFAGVWDVYEGPDAVIESVAMLTSDANNFCAEYHTRMPVIVPASMHDAWIDPSNEKPSGLLHALGPFEDRPMTATKVDRRMGNPRWDVPEAMRPIGGSLFD